MHYRVKFDGRRKVWLIITPFDRQIRRTPTNCGTERTHKVLTQNVNAIVMWQERRTNRQSSHDLLRNACPLSVTLSTFGLNFNGKLRPTKFGISCWDLGWASWLKMVTFEILTHECSCTYHGEISCSALAQCTICHRSTDRQRASGKRQ